MNLFYSKQIKKKNHKLSKEESIHCIHVLRKKINDDIYITEGKGIIYSTKIKNINKKIVSCEDLKQYSKHNIKNYIHIAIAPTKNRMRFEWFLEKVTEIGIHAITPIFCANSERKKINQARCEKIIISAMKQSHNCFLPQLHQPMILEDFIKKIETPTYIAHCQPTHKLDFKKILTKNKKCKRITVMIGPEGDFSNEEIFLSESAGAKSVLLSENRLRTETAGIIVCNTIKNLL